MKPQKNENELPLSAELPKRRRRTVIRIIAGILVPVVWVLACVAFSKYSYAIQSSFVDERPFQVIGLAISLVFLMIASGFNRNMSLRLRIDWIILYIMILGVGYCVTQLLCFLWGPAIYTFPQAINPPIFMMLQR